MSDLGDLAGEGLGMVIGPFIGLAVLISMPFVLIQKCCHKEEPTKVEEHKTMSYKAGQKARSMSGEFVKGLLTK